MVFEIVVEKEYEGNSPKAFIKKFVDVPYYKIPNLLKNKRITINGKKIKQDTKLKEGDVLKVWLTGIEPRFKPLVEKDSKDLGMLKIYENQDFVVLNKVAGVVVQGAQDSETSLSLHLNYLKKINHDTGNFDYIHVHRLDKDTSGVLVAGKNLIATRELNRIFKNREVVKKYVCLCEGSFDKKQGEIDVYLKRCDPGSKIKVAVCNEEEMDSRKTLSKYKVIDEYDFDDVVFSLVEVEIKTGFMHQIRVHMKYLGHPIVGDGVYGNSYVNRKTEKNLKRQFLHAKSLEFDFQGEHFKFEADFPDDLRNFMKKIDK